MIEQSSTYTANKPPRPKKTQGFNVEKVFATIGIVAIVLVLLVAALYYFVLNKEDQSLITLTDTTKIGSSSAKTATTSATAGWKTYSNQQLGFSIKYPKGKFCSNGPIVERSTNLAVKEAANEVAFKAFDCLSDFSFLVSVITQTYPELTTKYGGFTLISEKNIEIDGVQTKIKTYGADPGNIQIVYLKKGSAVYLFNYSGSVISQTKQGDELTTAEFEQMLSTFKFL